MSTASTAEALLARATLWRWAARAFWYPTDDFLASLRDPLVREHVEDACAVVDTHGALAAALQRCWDAADALADSDITLAGEHTFLFARHVRVPLCEAAYGEYAGADRATRLAELAGMYAAFGFQLSVERPEMPDHVSIESEFLGVLLAKEAYAEARGWADQADVTRDARERLVSLHLAHWLPALRERLAKHHRLAFYPAVAEVICGLLACEQTVSNLPPLVETATSR